MTIKPAFLLVLAAATPLMGQSEPDGLDIATAVPITFGQTVNDIMDAGTRPRQVYKLSLARGQQITARLTIPDARPAANIMITLWAPTTRTIGNIGCNASGALAAHFLSAARVVAFDYQVAAAGDYFLVACPFNGSTGVQYRLQVDAIGTPLLTTLPAQAGCLFGAVDFIEYSLRLIAVNLPDRLSIGGVEACATCTAKPPLYDAIVRKLEDSMRAGINVEACYDDKGNIFKVKLQR